ncbi:hypothetical protein L1887_43658 [Cichorium endivia]|nr:hypothetical protein L1887_43658 [Cichorium endivia]
MASATGLGGIEKNLVGEELGLELDGADEGLALEDLDDVLGLGGDILAGHLELLEELLGGGRGAEGVDAVLGVRVLGPAEGRVGLDREDGLTRGQHREAVVDGLGVEDREAWDRDDTALDALVRKLGDGLVAERHLGTGGDEGDVGVLVLDEDVATLGGLLDRAALELGQVLTGEGEDGGGVLALEGDEVGARDLVSVGGTPEHEVGDGAKRDGGLDGLVGGAVLAEADRVVGGDPDDAVVRERRETHGADGVRDKVEEGAGGGDVHAVGGETVHDGAHGVLTDTVSDVLARVVAELGAGVLEVDGVAPSGEVGAGQVGGAAEELGDGVGELAEDGLGELARGDGVVGGLVGGEGVLPALGELAGDAAGDLGVLVGVLVAVGLEELGPLLVGLGAAVGDLLVGGVDVFGDDEALLGVHAELGLDALDVVGLERGAVGGGEALLLGAEADGGLYADDRGLVGDLLGLVDGLVEALEVLVAVEDVRDVPSVGEEALLDVLGEGAGGVAVDGDVVVVVEGDEVAELEVTGERGGLGRDALLQAAVTGEHVGGVGEEGEAVLVEGGGEVGLCDGETDRVGKALSEGAGGDLDALGVAGLGVTGGLGVDLTESLELLHGEVLVAEEVVEDVDERTSVTCWVGKRDGRRRQSACLFAHAMETLSAGFRACVRTVGEDESVTVDPLGVSGVDVHESAERGVRSGQFAVPKKIDGQVPLSRGNRHCMETMLVETYREKRVWAMGAMPMGAPG